MMPRSRSLARCTVQNNHFVCVCIQMWIHYISIHQLDMACEHRIPLPHSSPVCPWHLCSCLNLEIPGQVPQAYFYKIATQTYSCPVKIKNIASLKYIYHWKSLQLKQFECTLHFLCHFLVICKGKLSLKNFFTNCVLLKKSPNYQ